MSQGSWFFVVVNRGPFLTIFWLQKLTLAEGVECECGLLLCGLHRYTDKHECAHDFKSADRAILEKNNQRCVDDKLENRI